MTLRETYIQELMALLRTLPDLPATVERSIVTAFNREESPVLVVHRGGEVLAEEFIGGEYRHCEILFSVVSRGDEPDKDADNVMEIAHPAIVGFTATRLTGIDEIRTDTPMFSDADRQACVVTTHYLFRYQTTPGSLSG